ncbi:MAG: GntR family transcriptional regulator [Actinobacteria bacterium]|nr:GntR family transcriptional regulator [Actinomycetota bacterium]
MITKDSPFPLYVQLAQYFRDKVRDGTFKPNSAIPSEFEIAREFNISRSTVRQAILELVHEGILLRVSGKGTYVSSDPFKQKFPPRSGVIGLIQPYLRDSFLTLITLSIESTTRTKGYQLMLSITDNKYEQHQRSVRQLLSKKVDGLIIFLPDNYPLDEITISLVEQRFNFVLIDRYIPNIDVSYVVSDNFGGAYQAMEHLIKLGHNRIGMVTRSSLQTTSVRDRVDGYKRALMDYRLPFDQSLVCDKLKTSASELEFFGTARGNSQHDVEVIVEFLKNKERPSAIFAINDLVALAVVEAASLVGLKIPDDLALVGFDDIDIVSHLETPLTTVAQDKYAIGAQAVELLIDKVEGREKGNRQIVISTKLIVRRSTVPTHEARQVAN